MRPTTAQPPSPVRVMVPRTRSWWVTDGTRESFRAAYAREQPRLHRSGQRTKTRVIATNRGRL